MKAEGGRMNEKQNFHPTPSSFRLHPSSLLFLRLGENVAAFKIYKDEWLIAFDPGIMTGWDDANVASLPVEFSSVVHAHLHAPGDDVPLVRDLAALAARDRLDALRPTPARLASPAHDRQAADLYRLRAPFIEWTCLIRVVKVLLNVCSVLCHANLPPGK